MSFFQSRPKTLEMREFYRRALGEKLNFRRVLLRVKGAAGESLAITSGDEEGLKFDTLSGDSAGDLTVGNMAYWEVVRVRRKLPRGSRNLTVNLEIL